MDAVQILRDIRVREANLLKLIGEVSSRDKSIASAFFNYSFDVQERLRSLTDDMLGCVVDAFFENTSTLFRLNMSLNCDGLTGQFDQRADVSHVKDFTENGKRINAIRAQERKILLLMRELALISPDTLKTSCRLSDDEVKRFRDISIDALLELTFMQRNSTIFRLKFDSKKLMDEFISWLREPAAFGLVLDRAS